MENKWFKKTMIKRSYRKLAGDAADVDLDNPNGNASICIVCGDCLDKCPQSIDIPNELEKVHAILGGGDKIEKHYP